MAVQITSSTFNGQNSVVTLYLPTGDTRPYSDATSISIGARTIPFTYEASNTIWEYGVFSIFLSGESKTCLTRALTPPDGDGNQYRIIKIGNQVWMSESLRTTKFQDGTPLSNTSQVSDAIWDAQTTEKYWALVNRSSGNTSTYGLLYNGNAITGSTSGSSSSNNLCPVGWHIPTQSELNTLVSTVGNNTNDYKAFGLFGGTNKSGFDALMSDVREPDGYYNTIINQSLNIWATTVNPINNEIYNLFISAENTGVSVADISKSFGLSVRCIKN
jgi:uncharacterized protein (TIGR02145 family)